MEKVTEPFEDPRLNKNGVPITYTWERNEYRFERIIPLYIAKAVRLRDGYKSDER